ncbi:MAG: polysaccharide deacetylase family protein [Chitinophagales bacterium]
MRKKALQFLRPVVGQLPLPWLMRAAACQVVLPFYHIVSNQECQHIRHLYRFKSVAEFSRDLDLLSKHFTFINLHQLHEVVERGVATSKRPKPLLHLSFDDGLKEMVTVVAPILKARGLPASFFINSAFVGNQQLMFRYKASLLCEAFPEKKSLFLQTRSAESLEAIPEASSYDFSTFLKEQQPYMDWSDIHQLQQWGFTIGSHSATHPYFSFLQDEQQVEEAVQPFSELEAHGISGPKYFAFPFTDDGVSAAVINRLLEDEGLTLSFGGAGCKRDVHPRQLQRLPLEETHYDAITAIKAELAYAALRGFVGRNTINR